MLATDRAGAFLSLTPPMPALSWAQRVERQALMIAEHPARFVAIGPVSC